MTSTFVFVGHPRETDERVIRAASYRAEMLDWIETGASPDRQPPAIAARQLREAIWYTAAAIVTANFGSIVMGAILLNEMNAYVATLLRAAKSTVRVALLAWNVWSVVRVGAYVLIGTAAAAPLLRLSGLGVATATARTLAVVGAIGVSADVFLKLALSGRCRRSLASAIDLAAAKANRSTEFPLGLHLDG